jgi:tetratricopeptide (TPR) repeat protein
MVGELRRDATSVPHSCEREALTAYAEAFLKARGVRRHGRYLTLLEHLGAVFALSGDTDRAREIFQRGRNESKRAVDDARFLYLIGNQIHFRAGEFHEARRAFEEIIARRRVRRDLKNRAYLSLSRTARRLRDEPAAERSADLVRRLGVYKYRPLAELYLGNVRMQQGRFDEAITLNRSAHAHFKRIRADLAMRVAECDLGLIERERGNYRKARAILERLAGEEIRILDTDRAGIVFNNLAAVCVELKDLHGARNAYLRALGFHAAGGRTRRLAETHGNVGSTLSRLGEVEAAFAACARSIELADGIGSADLGIRNRRHAIEAILRNRTHLGALSGLVAQCDEIIRKRGKDVSKETLHGYALAVAQALGARLQKGPEERRGKAPTISTRHGQALFREMTAAAGENRFRDMLTDRLGSGLRHAYAPPPDALRDFLLLFTGNYLKFHDYVSEFWLTLSRGKLHLRELCDRRVLDITGARKAAKYSLAFHRLERDMVLASGPGEA